MSWTGLFDKARGFVKGLLNKPGKLQGLFHKAKSVLGHGLSFLRSEPGKSLTDAVTKFIPSAGQYFDGARKYGSIASNMMSGGLDKKASRFVQHAKQEATIERAQRQKTPWEQEGLRSLFG